MKQKPGWLHLEYAYGGEFDITWEEGDTVSFDYHLEESGRRAYELQLQHGTEPPRVVLWTDQEHGFLAVGKKAIRKAKKRDVPRKSRGT